MPAIRFQLPPRCFILDAEVIMLKPGIALLSRLLGFALLIEARDRHPCTICRRLPSLGIETGRKGIRFGKKGTLALEIVAGDATPIHPRAQARVSDELGGTYRPIDSRILCGVAIDFILVDQHAYPFLLPEPPF